MEKNDAPLLSTSTATRHLGNGKANLLLITINVDTWSWPIEGTYAFISSNKQSDYEPLEKVKFLDVYTKHVL